MKEQAVGTRHDSRTWTSASKAQRALDAQSCLGVIAPVAMRLGESFGQPSGNYDTPTHEAVPDSAA